MVGGVFLCIRVRVGSGYAGVADLFGVRFYCCGGLSRSERSVGFFARS